MRRTLNDFLLMIQFFTRIPINKNLDCSKENFKTAAMFLPIVGLIIGMINFAIYILFKDLLPYKIIAIIILLITAMITGGLHLDGLADTFDGFFSLREKNKIMEIMKDSRIGSYGSIALIFDIILKIEILTLLIQKGITISLILLPIVGKNSILFLCLSSKTAKKSGSGNIFIGNMSKTIVLISSLFTLGVSTYFLGIKNALRIILTILIGTYLFYLLCLRKINGLTGDTLGASNEIIELIFLLTMLIIYR
ncbi:adenosylcobinamide-GDP ribazoletransferase [Clostridium niameyense]|uniref:Adenosylcobinamide-GDP ribazoletransferase n=1 Tax=Clostridium niameyense TaxID=1622073 RepID=A0A6M0RCX1_9CLOT|nr:adenosylcobinamide-GDP ribazoletransferase [Clostridium niameyense]NEZ47028.1 adenosylcobinamide-GDP ribazoletransferase [Clostridium niameyense]